MNTKFTAYVTDTGQVLYAGIASDIKSLANEIVSIFIGESYNGGYFEKLIHYDLPPQPYSYSEFNYVTKEWFDPRTTESQLVQIRIKRDFLLSSCDWIVTKAMDVGTPVPEDWRVYRQALREITLQPDVFNIIWPTAPQG